MQYSILCVLWQSATVHVPAMLSRSLKTISVSLLLELARGWWSVYVHTPVRVCVNVCEMSTCVCVCVCV